MNQTLTITASTGAATALGHLQTFAVHKESWRFLVTAVAARAVMEAEKRSSQGRSILVAPVNSDHKSVSLSFHAAPPGIKHLRISVHGQIGQAYGGHQNQGIDPHNLIVQNQEQLRAPFALPEDQYGVVDLDPDSLLGVLKARPTPEKSLRHTPLELLGAIAFSQVPEADRALYAHAVANFLGKQLIGEPMPDKGASDILNLYNFIASTSLKTLRDAKEVTQPLY